MTETRIARSRILLITALAAAAAVGYGVARLTMRPAPPPESTARPNASADSPAALEVPDSFLATMNIRLEAVSAGDLSAEIQASATVSAAPNGQAVVTARAPGTLTRLDKRLGDQVAAGEVLAIVDSRDAAAMAAERTAADSKLELARSVFRREQGLFAQGVTPRQDLETAQANLRAAEAEAERARAAAAAAGVTSDGRSLALVSPIAGRITVANAALGAYVEPGTELFRVADPRFVTIEAAVPAAEVKRVSPGDRAVVTTGAGASLDALVASVTPTLNEQTRAATVTLSLSSVDGAPAPGEFVRVRITTRGAAGKQIVVPDEAVQNVGGHDAVFVREAGSFRVAPVVVAARSGGRASIASGLERGDRIATTNAFLLKAELGKGAEDEE